MKMKSIVLIVIALGCGLVATIGISQVMDKNSGGGADVKMAQILVAKGDIDIGMQLDANSVELEEWPAAKIPEGTARSLEEVTGKFPQVRFYKGEPILQAKISNQNEAAANLIPVGYQTSTVKVDEDTVMEGIGPGDRVDIMVFLRKSEEIRQTGVYPLLKNVRVFSKGAQTERILDSKKQEVRARTISLIVKPAQAREIALASEVGRIRLALRNPKDDPADDKDEVIPLAELLAGKSSDGDDKKDSRESIENKGFMEMLQGAKNAAGSSFPQPDLAKAPAFRMRVLTPNDVKMYDWADTNEMPVESTLSSVAASGGAPQIQTTASPNSPAPPSVVEPDSKQDSEESSDNP